MSKRRGKRSDYVHNSIYANHLNGGMKNNPSRNRLQLIESMYRRVLTELCVNRFEWKNLPQGVDARFLELTLFYQAMAIFYWDTDFKRFMALRGAGHGPVNMYDNPTQFLVIGNTMVNKNLSHKQAVPIYSNYLRYPDTDIVEVYASKLADLDRTIEINSHNMRYSKLVTVEESQRLSATNVIRQYDEGGPVIMGSRSLDMNDYGVFDLGVPPETLEKLLIARSKLWNECMTLLGIKNSNQDKKERLVADEVHANSEQIDSMRAVNLNAREQAVELIKARWPELDGLEVGFKIDTYAQQPLLLGLDEEGDDE